MAESPKLPVALGSHAAVWFMDGMEISGEFEASALTHPSFSLFGDVVPPDPSRISFSPNDHEFERVVGRLRSGQDVVLTAVGITIWFPDRGIGGARSAVVGLNIADVPGDAYRRVRMQITGAETLFGVSPIHRVFWPSGADTSGPEKYSVEVNPDANRSWTDDGLGMTATCEFESRFTFGNPFHHELSFAPVVELTSHTPLTIDQWIAPWVRPLLKVATLATGQPQKLSWLVVEALPDGEQTERSFPPTGQLFASGIQQNAYEAEYRDEMRRPENRPLFTFATMPVMLPALLRR